MHARAQLGAAGETIAADYLATHGYVVRDRNVRTPFGEIDLLCTRQRMLVVVEVKTRTSHAFGTPEVAVTRAKQRRLIRAAEWYRTQCPMYHQWPYTIDVVAITWRAPAAPDVLHVANAVEGIW
ncbi:YraN family protein [Candidatus Uhrbacteria bacterium]|nr:YraN family protein [Candidatus Uhrbacteria bacterium]